MQVVQNKRIWDVPEVEDVHNDHINVLEIVVSHQVDDHIEDDTLCRIDVDPTIAERPIVRHVTNNFIDDVDEHLSHASKDELVTNHVPTYLSGLYILILAMCS